MGIKIFMDPRLLYQLSVIVKYGSLSRAATRLHVTQPTLTRTVQIIENRVGGPVLKRTSTGVVPTEIGAHLAQLGEGIGNYSERSDALIEQWRQGLGQEVRIGVGPLIGIGAMGDFFPKALKDSRNKLHFITETAGSLLTKLNNDDLDLVLAPMNTDVAQENLLRHTLLRDEMGIFVGRKSKFFGAKHTVSVDELMHETWVASGVSSRIYDEISAERPLPDPKMSFTGSIDLVINFLHISDIVVLLPKKVILMSNRLERKHLVDVDIPMPPRDVGIWQHQRTLENPDVNRIAEQIKAHFQSLQA